jgi:hypothetical protein
MNSDLIVSYEDAGVRTQSVEDASQLNGNVPCPHHHHLPAKQGKSNNQFTTERKTLKLSILNERMEEDNDDDDGDNVLYMYA